MKIAKSLFGFTLLGVFASGIMAATMKIFHLSPESGERLVEGVLKCVTKLNFDSSVLNLIKEGKYFDDAKVLETFICMNVERGIGTADGRVSVDGVMNDFFSNNAIIRAALERCEKEYDGTPVGNLRGILTCLKEHLPFKVRL